MSWKLVRGAGPTRGRMQLIAVQLDIAWEDRPANHQKVRSLLEVPPPSSDSMIVLPEMFDVGFSMNTAATKPGIPSKSEAFCQQLAGETRSTVLAGIVADAQPTSSPMKPSRSTRRARNWFDIGRCNPSQERVRNSTYLAGTGHRLFRWNGLVVAPFVCYDLPSRVVSAGRERGAELFVVIANWPEKRSEHWVRLLQGRAIENQAYVLGVNRAGADPKLSYDGRSSLFDPLGKELFQADRREQVLPAQIDPAAVRQWRQDFGALRDMKRI